MWNKIKETITFTNMRIFFRTIMRILAFVTIIVMFLADFEAMKRLFDTSRNVTPRASKLYSFIMASGLEISATFIGYYWHKIIDKHTRYKKTEKKYIKIGFILSVFTFLVAFAISAILRGSTIYIKGGWEAYLNGTYKDFTTHVFLVFSPLLTSLFAFLCSWYAFRSSNEEELRNKVERLQNDYMKKNVEYNNVINKLEDVRTAHWTTITDHLPMPNKLSVFRKESFSRLRSDLIEDCISIYPTEIERYNAAIECLLQAYIIDLSKKSTIPQDITNIDLQESISKYDIKQSKSKNYWRYSYAKDALETELGRLLDNAVIVAQTKVTSVPHIIEGDPR